MDPTPATFCLFLFFSDVKYSKNLTISDKSVVGVLETLTWGGKRVGADESTELWLHPIGIVCYRCDFRSFLVEQQQQQHTWAVCSCLE